eukprot:1157757-Pelagomonas_calceolata.AAC.10
MFVAGSPPVLTKYLNHVLSQYAEAETWQHVSRVCSSIASCTRQVSQSLALSCSRSKQRWRCATTCHTVATGSPSVLFHLLSLRVPVICLFVLLQHKDMWHPASRICSRTCTHRLSVICSSALFEYVKMEMPLRFICIPHFCCLTSPFAPVLSQYAEMEMRHRFINHARNVWDRAVTLLPRVDQLWYKVGGLPHFLPISGSV